MNDAISTLAEAIQAVRDAGLDYRISDVCASVKTDAQSLWITQIHDGTDADRGRALWDAFEQWKAKYGAKPGPDTVPRADYEAVCKELAEASKDIKWLRAMSPANQLMPVGTGTLPVNWDGMQTLLTRALKAEEEVEDLLAERDALRAELDALRERTITLVSIDARLRKLEDGTA